MTQTSSLYFFDDFAFEQRALSVTASRRQKWDQLYSSVQPQLHASVASLSRTYPSLPAGILAASAQAGLAPEDPGLANLAEDFTQDQEQGWNFMKTVSKPFEFALGAVKAQVRNATMVFDTMWEEVLARPLRTVVGAYQGMGLAEAYAMAGPSIGMRSLDKWLENPLGHSFDWMIPGSQIAPEDRINLGSGFLLGSDFVDIAGGDDPTNDPNVQANLISGMDPREAVAEANRQYGQPITNQFYEQANAIQISKGGKSTGVSPGRLLAMTVSEPDTAVFNAMSGVADFAAQIYLDPADKVLKGLKLAKLARNTLLPDGARKATTLRGALYGRLAPSLDSFLESSLGNDLARFTAESDNFSEIRSIYGRKVQGSQHIRWIKQLTDEKDPTRIKNHIRNAFENPTEGLYAGAAPVNLGLLRRNRRGVVSRTLGGAIGGDLGKIGGVKVAIKHRLEGGTMYRLFSQMGGKAVPVGDLAVAVDELENFMSSAGFRSDEISELLYEMAGVNADNYEEVLAVTRKAVDRFGAKLRDEGLPAPAVDYFTNIFKTHDDIRKYFITQAGNPAMFPGAKFSISSDGTKQYLPTAHLMTEFLNRAVPLPNPREVRRVINRLGSKQAFGMSLRIETQADLSEGAITKLMDGYMGKIWKPMTLIRVAWPVRVIGEEQLRMVGGDLDSVFRHPVQYMGWAIHSKSRLGRHVGNVLRGETGVLGNNLDEAQEYQKAMSTYRSFGLDVGIAPGPRDFIKVEKGDPRYGIGITREYTQLAADPIAPHVAAAGLRAINEGQGFGDHASFFDAIKQEFFDGKLAQYRKRFINDSGHFELLENRRWADGYIDSIWARITDKSGGRYDYFDTDGVWYDGLTQKPLDSASIPADLARGVEGGSGGAGAANLVEDMLRQLELSGETPQATAIGGLIRELDDMINDLATSGQQARGGELDRIAGVLDDANQSMMEGSFGDGRVVTEDRDFLRQGLDDLKRFLDEDTGDPNLAPPRQRILGNEVEDLRNLADTPRAGRTVEPFPAAIETLDPMGKTPAIRAPGTPNGASRINGTDPNRPRAVVVAHDEVVLLQVGIEWDADGIARLHINGSDMSGMPDQTFPNPSQNLRTAMQEIETLGGITPESILDMLMGGVPVRDWLMSSPALRHLSMDDALRMSPSELLGEIADSGERLGFTVEDVVDSLRKGRQGRDEISGLPLAADDERVGVMFAQAMRFEASEQWNELVEQARQIGSRAEDLGGVAVVPPGETLQMTTRQFVERAARPSGPQLREAPAGHSQVGPFLDRLEVATGNRQEAQERLIQALEAEHRSNPDQLGGVATSIAEARSKQARSALPLLSPPGNYPVTHQGARAMRGFIRRQLTPEAVQAIPLDRPMYHLRESGNIELIEAIATGKLRGQDITKVVNKRDAQKIAGILTTDFADAMPRFSKTTLEPDRDTESLWDAAISTMFSEFMSKPTNQLSRSPAFRQFYWRRVARMMPFMDEASQAEMLRRAADAGIKESFLKNELRNFARKSVGRERVGRSEVELERLAQFPVQITTGPADLSGVLDGKDAAVGLDALEDIDMVAKAYALEETQRLLYDITRKHDIADMTRNIFPFAEAWGEILTSWLRIFAENPRMLRRLQQAVEGARGSGWLYEDPATGEEVFNYPGSGLISRWMMGDNAALQLAGGVAAGAVGGVAAGAGIPGAIGGGLVGGGAAIAAGGVTNESELGDASLSLTGRAQGLNLLAGSYLPGFGPIVQIPMSNLMSEQLADPDWRWVRDLVLPFGAQDVESPGELIIDTALPAWFRKGLTSLAKGTGDDQRLYANTVIDVYKALLTGSHSDDTPEEASLTMERAKEIAKNIYRIRAIAQFAAPTGPQVRFDVRDKNGQNWTFINLAQEWARIEAENDFDEVASFAEFTQRFGLDPTLFATAKTTSIVPRTTTEAGLDWQNEHSELFEEGSDYFFTAYFARPDSPFATFDYPAYLEQIKNNTRQGLTPEQWQSERNDFLGRIAYERARRMVLGRTDDAVRGWLRQTRYQLMEEYPGYNSPTVGIGKRVEREQMLRSFEKWGANPVLANTEAGEGLALYLGARDEAIRVAAQLGISEGGFSTAKRTAYLRRWLEEVGKYYATIHPDFGPIYDRVMRHELEDEESQIASLQLAGGN